MLFEEYIKIFEEVLAITEKIEAICAKSKSEEAEPLFHERNDLMQNSVYLKILMMKNLKES